MTKLSELKNKLTTGLEAIAKLSSKSDRIEENLNKFASKFKKFVCRFDKLEVSFKKKMMDINKTITTAFEEVTEKLSPKTKTVVLMKILLHFQS